MTLLGQQDGADANSGASYLDLVAFIFRNGRQVNKNLKELWTRIVFNMLVKNTDDHLRNHGFFLFDGGWELSPAYDMNDNPRGTGLTLNVSENENSLDIELALSIAGHFRIKSPEAQALVADLQKVVSRWQEVTAKYKLSRREQEFMANAFEAL